MFEATTIQRWRKRADLAARSALREWCRISTRMIGADRQGHLPADTADKINPVLRSAKIAAAQRSSGRGIAEVHGTAAIKIDAAEYAYTMMVAELRSVMKSAPYGRPSTTVTGFIRLATMPEVSAQAA